MVHFIMQDNNKETRGNFGLLLTIIPLVIHILNEAHHCTRYYPPPHPHYPGNKIAFAVSFDDYVMTLKIRDFMKLIISCNNNEQQPLMIDRSATNSHHSRQQHQAPQQAVPPAQQQQRVAGNQPFSSQQQYNTMVSNNVRRNSLSDENYVLT